MKLTFYCGLLFLGVFFLGCTKSLIPPSLYYSAAIQGSVLGLDGSPQEDVSLSLYTSSNITTSSLSTSSDHEGNFSFSALDLDTYTIIASDSDGNSGSSIGIILEDNTTYILPPISLELPSGALNGTVTDSDGNVLELVHVQVLNMAITATTNANGVYSLSDITEGVHTLLFVKEGFLTYVTENITISAESTTELDASLSYELGSLSGTVLGGGGGVVDGATVTLVGTSYTTNSVADGTFSLTDIHSGTYTLQIVESGYSTYSVSIQILAQETTSLSIQLE